MNTKICYKCKKALGATTKYYAKNKSKPDGLAGVCKLCHKRYKQTAKYKEYIKKYNEEYVKRPGKKEHIKKYSKEYSKKYEQSLKRKTYKSNYHKTQKYKTIAEEYKQRNPEKVRALDHKRKALFYNAPGIWTEKDEKEMFLIQEGKCYYCGNTFIPLPKCKSGFHIEHKIPLCRGGSNWPENLCLSCPTCNLRKLKKTEEEFKNS